MARLFSVLIVCMAIIAFVLIVSPPGEPAPDRFYAAERQRLALEHDRLALEEARWSSQARQMAWARQLSQPQVVQVQAPASAGLTPLFMLVSFVAGAALVVSGALVAIVLSGGRYGRG